MNIHNFNRNSLVNFAVPDPAFGVKVSGITCINRTGSQEVLKADKTGTNTEIFNFNNSTNEVIFTPFDNSAATTYKFELDNVKLHSVEQVSGGDFSTSGEMDLVFVFEPHDVTLDIDLKSAAGNDKCFELPLKDFMDEFQPKTEPGNKTIFVLDFHHETGVNASFGGDYLVISS